MWALRVVLSGYPAHMQDCFVCQINSGFPALLCASPPLTTNQSSEIQPPNKSAYYRAPMSRSNSSMTSTSTVPTSVFGPSGSASNFGIASTSDSTTYNSPPLARVYLKEPRGVHIGNAPLDTSESEIRHLVARAVHILEEQILDVSLPSNAHGNQTGYATVSFDTRKLAEFASDVLDGISLGGSF